MLEGTPQPAQVLVPNLGSVLALGNSQHSQTQTGLAGHRLQKWEPRPSHTGGLNTASDPSRHTPGSQARVRGTRGDTCADTLFHLGKQEGGSMQIPVDLRPRLGPQLPGVRSSNGPLHPRLVGGAQPLPRASDVRASGTWARRLHTHLSLKIQKHWMGRLCRPEVTPWDRDGSWASGGKARWPVEWEGQQRQKETHLAPGARRTPW